MNTVLQSMDIGPIGTVTLSNGVELQVPRLSNAKVIKIVKFLGVDGTRLYKRFQAIMSNDALEDAEKWATLLTELPEETIIRILSILLEMDDKQALQLDPIDTLEIIEVYVDKTDLKRAFTSVRTLAKKLFKIEIPDMQTILKRFEEVPGNDSSDSSSSE